MFKYKKRSIYAFLAMLLIMSTFSSCGNDNKTASVINSNKNTSTLKGEVTLWTEKETEDAIKYAAESFKKNNPEVNINIVSASEEDIKNNYDKASTSGKDIPDIIETKTESVPYFISKYSEQFTDLKDSLGSLKNSIANWKLNEVTFDSKIYAVPWNLNPIVMLYNKKLCDLYNIDPFDLKTWDDFTIAGESLLTKNSSLKLMALSSEENDELLKYILREASEGMVGGDKGINVSDSQKAIGIMKKLKTGNILYDDGTQNTLESLKQGKALCMMADSTLIKSIFEDSSNSWDIERLPALEPGGKTSVQGDEKVFMVSKAEKTNQAALEFVKFLVSDSNVNLNAFNTKGYLSSVNDFKYLPSYNSANNNFQGKKVWRFLLQESSEQTPIKYFDSYESLSSKLFLVKNKILYENGDIEASLQQLNKEINEQGDIK